MCFFPFFRHFPSCFHDSSHRSQPGAVQQEGTCLEYASTKLRGADLVRSSFAKHNEFVETGYAPIEMGKTMGKPTIFPSNSERWLKHPNHGTQRSVNLRANHGTDYWRVTGCFPLFDQTTVYYSGWTLGQTLKVDMSSRNKMDQLDTHWVCHIEDT
jgi:hypothetical protein